MVAINNAPRVQHEGREALIESVREWLSRRCHGGLDDDWDPLGLWPGEEPGFRRDGGRTEGTTSAPRLIPGVPEATVNAVRAALVTVLIEYAQQWEGPVGNTLASFAHMRKELDALDGSTCQLRESLEAVACIGGSVGDDVQVEAAPLASSGLAEVEALTAAVAAMRASFDALEPLLRRPLRRTVREGVYESTANVPLNRMCLLLDEAGVDRVVIAKAVGLYRDGPDASVDRVRKRVAEMRKRLSDTGEPPTDR
ncbi:MAG: hypothetical protein OXU20_09555 [Myxococcales bacterium]|nr:hypothetical protein [Myxococcales bacterium]MDD9966656.1 hypothetical protein [Myxococcales bacterium]